jgi:hypothetical protein
MAADLKSPNDDTEHVPIGGQRPPGWQYSLRGLLVVITIVSISLAVGIHYQGIMVAIVAIGIIQGTILLAGDWLIQRRNWWALALLTSIFWAIPGCGLLLLGVGVAVSSSIVADRGVIAMASLCAIAGGAFCYFMAVKRWRQLTAERRQLNPDEQQANALRH